MAYTCQQGECDKILPSVEGIAVLLRIFIIVVCVVSWLLPVEGADTTIIGGKTRVIDGDTLEVKGVEVRLQGIDAPEKRQMCKDASGKLYPCGEAATEALRKRVGGSNVSCALEPQRDRYGRALAEPVNDFETLTIAIY